MVAAIAAAHGLTVVTSNERNFATFEIPWTIYLEPSVLRRRAPRLVMIGRMKRLAIVGMR
jgi:hypothetical protein